MMYNEDHLFQTGTNNMLDSIEDFRIISSIYRTLSLTVSSEEFNISPATMSKKLKAIEDRLGKRLFNRSTRKLSPTEDGEIYYNYCIEILEKVDSFEQNTTQTEPEGVIKFTTSTTFARLYLMPVIKKFVKKYPKVKVDMILTDQVIDIIKEGIDVAIRIAPLKDSSLISRRIGDGRLVICASKEYVKKHGVPKTPSDLRNHNCITFGSSNWTFQKGRKEQTVKVKGDVRINYGEMLAQAVESDMGISILSLWLIHNQIKSSKVVTLLDDYELSNQPDIYLVYPEKNLIASKTRVFIDFIVDELKLPFK